MSGVHRPSISTKSTVRKVEKSKKNFMANDSDQEINRKGNHEENDRQSGRRKDSVHTDLIERLIIEASSQKPHRRTSIASSNHSSNIDRLLQDENNDWFFEKILEKFENIQSKKVNRYERSFSNDFDDEDDVPCGIERIIERRYYVRKPQSTVRRNQLTSTSDLTGYGNKNRQYSGVSSMTAATTICSRCSSSTPTYVENLREQSDTLRTEINGLKNEIEQLQVSQQELFQQLRGHFQSKSNLPTGTSSQNFASRTASSLRSTPEKKKSSSNIPIRLTTGQKSRSISSVSQISSSSKSSESTTTTIESTAKPNAPSRVPAAPALLISEFTATKNPSLAPAPTPSTFISSKLSSIAPTPPVNGHVESKPSSTASTPTFNSKPSLMVSTSSVKEQVNSKLPFMASISPVKGQVNSKLPFMASISPVKGQVNSKLSPIAPSPPVNGHVSSKSSSTASTPTFNSKPSLMISTSSVKEQVNSKLPFMASISPVKGQVNSKLPFMASISPVKGQVNSKLSPIAPSPPVNGHVSSKSSSTASTPTFNSKPSLMVSTSSVKEQVNSKPPSMASTPPVKWQVNSKLSSIAQTPPSTEFPTFKSPVIGPVVVPVASDQSRTSSVASAQPGTFSPASLTRVPIHENELAHRRVLSPRSQIVTSSASIPDSSESSSGSASPELTPYNPRQNLQAPVTTLHTNDLNDLVRYSSQLELSGFPPSITPVISNPNTDGSFWNSVDQYIENAKSTNINIGLPPIPRSNNTNRFGPNNNKTRQLDKYDLEIKPQEFIQFSAPLLMPPLDTLP